VHAWLLLGGPILFAVGAWTVVHPDDGYRAAGGLGSSLSPTTRRGAGVLLTSIGFGLFLVGIVGVVAGQ
jgi:hypothetical protein